MHEGALTEDLFEHVMIHAKESHARRVTRIKVTIGALSDATAESITLYFNALAEGSIAEKASLEFETAPGTAKCNACGKELEVKELLTACPECNAFPLTITGGSGVYLSSLELETDEENGATIDG